MEAPRSLKKSRDCHVLEVHNAGLPCEANKAVPFENDAGVLDFRSDICTLFRGQNVRNHHSLWVIFLI